MSQGPDQLQPIVKTNILFFEVLWKKAHQDFTRNA